MLYDFHSATLLYRVISIICQTLVYGIYLCLFPIAVYLLLSRKLYTRSRRMLYVTMVVMFVLSTIYWVTSVVVTFLLIRAWFSELDPTTHSPPNWLPMFSAVLLVNLLITDGVVVWRAWVICADQNRAILMTPVVMLVFDSLAYLTTVGVRAGLLIVKDGTRINEILSTIIDIAQVGNLVLSLLTNVTATSIIATKNWKYRKSLISYDVDGYTVTRASKVLCFLVESGMLYVLVGAIVLASIFIRLRFATLGDILQPVGVQLAGVYPIIVLLIVDLNLSFKTATYPPTGSTILPDNEDRVSHLGGPLSFAPETDLHQSSESSSEESLA